MADISVSLTGSLHPHLLLSASPAPGPDCVSYLRLSFPDALFVDPDELADQWGPSRPVLEDGQATVSSPSSPAANPHAWSLSPRVVDIERPLLPSAGLSHLTLASNSPDVDIPLHARYLPPSSMGGHNVTVFGPGGGSVQQAWVCGAQVGQEVPLVEIGAPLSVLLPAAEEEYIVAVELITSAVVWLGFAWLAYKIVQVARSGETGGEKSKTE